MLEKPYVGVTGVDSEQAAKGIAQIFKEAGLTKERASHKAMAGYLVSLESITRGFADNTKYPPIYRLHRLMSQTAKDGILNALHYYSADPEQISAPLTGLLKRESLISDGLVQAVQINIPWPGITQLDDLKQSFPELGVILQLGPRVIEATPHDQIPFRLNKYALLADYVLIDSSGGKGREFTVEDILPFYEAVKASDLDITVIFAGGFSPDNVRKRIERVSQAIGTKNCGIDVEDRVRSPWLGDKHGLLDLNKVAKYVYQAADYFLANDGGNNPPVAAEQLPSQVQLD